MKSILQYPGSKWRIAKQIVSLFPPHHTYLEPYFGSGAVLFNKSRSDIETINDLDENVVNFFQWLKMIQKSLPMSYGIFLIHTLFITMQYKIRFKILWSRL